MKFISLTIQTLNHNPIAFDQHAILVYFFVASQYRKFHAMLGSRLNGARCATVVVVMQLKIELSMTKKRRAHIPSPANQTANNNK